MRLNLRERERVSKRSTPTPSTSSVCSGMQRVQPAGVENTEHLSNIPKTYPRFKLQNKGGVKKFQRVGVELSGVLNTRCSTLCLSRR